MAGRPGFITDPQDVVAVLLSDGRWYDVDAGSFRLGTWEVGAAATGQFGGIEAARLGFRFTVAHSGHDVVGSIAGLAAVRVRSDPAPPDEPPATA
jgi:hypothetical protein